MTPLPHPALNLPPDLWRRDESLRRAAELIEISAGRIRAVSFDFFDTLVWRLADKPVEAFREVGHRLRQNQLLRPTISADDFKILRQVAETKTRERQAHKDTSSEDIRIRDIYEQMTGIVPDPAAGVEIEHAVESDFCQLNPVMVGFIQHLRQLGLRVLVVSDIYLSADQLRGILRANQFDPGIFEAILSSADIDRCKGTGNLFRHALKLLKLEADQLLHVGDNPGADVIGARKAGVRGCHYRQASPETSTILDREKFLLGGQYPVFSANSLRLLAARAFPGDTDESRFGRMGALLLGPVLTRFASWACDQYVASGVRKVGAFMREGELLARILQREADVRGLDLEIKPLFVNRKATALASLGKLSADRLVDWLVRRQTLPIQTILEHFGLPPEDIERSPVSPNEKADTRERILKLAKYLFTPSIAGRIEAKSAEERRKVIDYLRPWLESGGSVGLCDIGYNASAQKQLQYIFDLEGNRTHLVGCYLITGDGSAARILESLDVRHYLGSFGRPEFLFNGFLRSPAFIEQSFVAPIGTTLGYARQADGEVTPVLDKVLFDEATLRRQHQFKEGIVMFQNLWHWFRAARPGLLDGSTELSRRILADMDCGFTPILGRATAFPTHPELTMFGSLPLDDYYFADSLKPMCGASDREKLGKLGYARVLGEAGIHWPQGVYHSENPRTAADFFSCGKAMLMCNASGDNDGMLPELTIVVPPQQNAGLLRECLNRLKPACLRNARCKVILLAAKDDRVTESVAQEFGREIKRICVLEALPQQTGIQQLNLALDGADSPFVAIIDGSASLPADWDEMMLNAIRSTPDVAIVLPSLRSPTAKLENAVLENAMDATTRFFLLRKSAFIEGLGFKEDLGRTAAIWNLIFRMRELGWKINVSRQVAVETKTSFTNRLPATDAKFIKQNWPGVANRIAAIFSEAPTEPTTANINAAVIDWAGSFLDHGSLSHVNRELTAALQTHPGIHLHRVGNGTPTSPNFEKLAREISSPASPTAAVTIRHSWPPDWKRPQSGKLVVIQPWEFGPLPQDWVNRARAVDEFWVPTQFVRDRYVESGIAAEKVFVVPNGIDPKIFNPQAAPMKLATQKKFKFLFVGGTIGRKGPDLLLKAYLDTFTDRDDVCLVIKDFGGKTVYQGQTFAAQIQAAQARPGAPEILYLDTELPADALPGLYTACDCLAHPYRGEGFGLPILEAMACSLPVIVTAGGAADDFAREEFAFRIPSRRVSIGDMVGGMKLTSQGWLLEADTQALAAKMKWVVANSNGAREQGARASEYARREWTWDRAAQIAGQRLQALVADINLESPDAKSPVERNGARNGKSSVITPSPVSRLGHLDDARAQVNRGELEVAWNSTVSAIGLRPFHPEGFLLLAEIALAAGDARSAKLCANRARDLAPNWKPAKQFLKKTDGGGVKGKNDGLMPLITTDVARLTSNTSRLSVCLIAKNEERFLPQCLTSIKDIANQIIVVDTGSTDRTVEIAKEYGAEVYSFAWNDDFSAARNAALEHATGDWILMLDADEELPAEQHPRLLNDLRRAEAIACRLPLVDYGQEGKGQSYVPRLFRNAPEVFYYSRIHEQVFPSLVECGKKWGLITAVGTAQLLHYGYTKEIVKDRNKTERNLRLLRLAIEEQPEEPNLQMNLGLELIRAGDLDTGLVHYREAFQLMATQPPAGVVPELREVLLTQFTHQLHKVRAHDEIVRTLNSPLAKNGGLTTSLNLALGLAYFELKQFSEAADQMRQCLTRRKQTAFSPINPDVLTAVPHHCLAMSLLKHGDIAGAEKAFQAGLSEKGDELKLDYSKFLVLQNRPLDALRQLHEIVRGNAGHIGSWRLGGEIALSKPEFLKFASDWTGEAIRYLPEDSAIVAQRAEALMLSQDSSAALPLWSRAINGERPPRAVAAKIICGLMTGQPIDQLQNSIEETAVSRAFVTWYRRLAAVGARATIIHLNSHVEKLRPILPSAATVVDGVIAATREPQTAETAKA